MLSTCNRLEIYVVALAYNRVRFVTSPSLNHLTSHLGSRRLSTAGCAGGKGVDVKDEWGAAGCPGAAHVSEQRRRRNRPPLTVLSFDESTIQRLCLRVVLDVLKLS